MTMRALATTSARLGAACVIALALAAGASGVARAASSEPLFVFTPQRPSSPFEPAIPPPSGVLEGPCGLTVDSLGNFYVSDYYHHAVDVFGPDSSYHGQLAGEDPLDGPCGLAVDSTGRLYVNNFHRNVVRFEAFPSFGAGALISGAPLDASQPTGVAIDPATDDLYVDERTHIAVYDSSGAPVLDGEGHPLKVGLGSLGEGYGVAISRFPATAGLLYVPDAADDTIKVYDPTLDADDPVATIDGHDTPNGEFSSLRDTAIAVDRMSGEIYLADNLQPSYTERPQATIDVFDSAGAYEGHLKYNIVDALPPGLAVDNSAGATQGRVYVTSGNTAEASVLAYPPEAATDEAQVCVPDAVCPPDVGVEGPGTFAARAEREGGPEEETARRGAAPASRRGAGASQVVQKDALRVSLSGNLAPQRLPRKGTAPVAVSVEWRLGSADGAEPAKLERLALEINRHGRFDYAGLPLCPYARIQPASSQRALAACRSALVGQGRFAATIGLRGQEPYESRGRLLVFNGRKAGKPVLFGQIYSPRPFATSFVIVFKVRSIAHGAYGTALSAALPPALSHWGSLTGIQMTLARHYTYRGVRHSYLSAGCPAPEGFGKAVFPLARASFAFAGGTRLDSVLTDTCRVG